MSSQVTGAAVSLAAVTASEHVSVSGRRSRLFADADAVRALMPRTAVDRLTSADDATQQRQQVVEDGHLLLLGTVVPVSDDVTSCISRDEMMLSVVWSQRLVNTKLQTSVVVVASKLFLTQRCRR